MIKIGDIVVAIAGKEKNQKFVVVDCDEKYFYIANGKRVKINKPKKKNAKHIQKASKLIFPLSELNCLDEMKVNASIRKFLKEED